MSGVKRYMALGPMMEPDEIRVGGYVLASDYDRDTQAMMSANMDLQVNFDTVKAERDTLRAQVEAMRAVIDLYGPDLLDILRFSVEGRQILDKINAAMKAKP